MYINDTKFLKQLDKMHNRTTHVRITALSMKDMPMETIEGRVTGGSINIDGKSAIRRSCSLSLLAEKNDTIVTDIYWCYNTKFKLEIGLTNNVNTQYPDIVWFNMGIYVITSFSKSESTNSFTISISGKDKMCRLNGEVGGSIPASTDFGTKEEVDEDDDTIVTITKLPIREIILNALREYGQELNYNIIINDLPDYGYELWDYRGDNALYYILESENTKKISNITLSAENLISNETNFKFYLFNTLDPSINENVSTIDYEGDGVKNPVAKIEYGETAGYHQTPLVYNTDLILNAGDSVTSLLDKLVGMLGDFEYFYDLNGHFVFQKKKTYVQELFSPINGDVATPTMMATMYSYKFDDYELFTNVSYSPNINELKNEYSIWGNRKTAAGIDMPIHVRYAVQKKPSRYKSPYPDQIDGGVGYRYEKVPGLLYAKFTKFTSSTVTISDNTTFADAIAETEDKKLYYKDGNTFMITHSFIEGTTDYYTMEKAKDSYKPSKDKQEYQLYQTIVNGKYVAYGLNATSNYYYKYNTSTKRYEALGTPTSHNYVYYLYHELPYYTRHEATYTTSNYDWREIIYQMAVDYYEKGQKDNSYHLKIQEANPEFINGKTGYEQYYVDMLGFWRQLYNPNPSSYDIYSFGDYYKTGEHKYWNKNIHIDPAKLNFWFDFLDTGGEIAKYGVDVIGSRPKVINDTKISSIYYKETPEVLFILPDDPVAETTAYAQIQISSALEELFYRSTQGISAIEKVNELINSHLAIAEGVNITSIPIFYLQPNTRIYVEGVGDCILEKLSYNLSYNGTMQLTCNKVLNGFV